MRSTLPPLGYAVLAALLCRDALRPDHLLGVWSGEAWGRAFVTRQVLRWLDGATPPGHADLLNHPDGAPLWPIDPALQLLQLPAEALLGAGQGLALAAWALLLLNGLLTARLARAAGAPPLPAHLAGLLAMLAPYLLRNLGDAVIEACAVGSVALAAEALLRAVPDPTPRRLALAGAAVLLLALTSPYLAVYLALACAVLLPLTARAHLRGWLRVALPCALACGLALAPLRAAETGAHGRFGDNPALTSGYSLDPGPLIDPLRPGAPPTRRPPPAPTTTDDVLDGPLAAAARAIPGGGALLLAMLAALVLPGPGPARRWAAGAAAVFLLGPGLPMTIRAVGLRGLAFPSPIEVLLKSLPLTDTLGNPSRLLALWVVLAAVAGALAVGHRRRWLGLLLGLAVAAEALLILPGLALPATPIAPPRATLAALEGPTSVFPSGDYPLFHVPVAPKEALLLAALAEVPVPVDYGRFRTPADLPLQLQLSAAARLPYSIRATEAPPPLHPVDGVTHLLLLEDRLSAVGRAGARAWLEEAGAVELHRQDGASAWRLR